MNHDGNHRGMKIQWNNKPFSSLNFINGKSSPYGGKGILRHDHRYRSDTKLDPCIVTVRRITCSFHYCTTILSLSWDSKIKESFNQPRYGRLYNFKYSQVIGCHNN